MSSVPRNKDGVIKITEEAFVDILTQCGVDCKISEDLIEFATPYEERVLVYPFARGERT